LKQLFIKKGKIIVGHSPLPHCDANEALIRLAYSVISVGTEISSVKGSKKESLTAQVGRHPSKALKAVDMIKDRGLIETIKTVQTMRKGIESPPAETPGYSCAGIVAAVGANLIDIKPGDRVACGGLGKAVHAEVVSVPRNLIIKVPDGVSLKDAASATIGAIAMQGVRRADVRLGEYVAVIGLGLIGQITVQILKAAGCRAIGIDLIEDKLKTAGKNGIYHAINAAHYDPIKEVLVHTYDQGVDACIITAGSSDEEIVQQAMEMTRKKGTVVVVGGVPMNLKRRPFYRKEIDFKISCSYGPGRYDELYEEKGIDYPYAYVRWTENRNMGEYLRMIDEGKIDFASLVSKEAKIDDAPEIYDQLKSPDNKLMGIILAYNFDESLIFEPRERVVSYEVKTKTAGGKIKVGLIGAGGFAKGTHLPNLASLSELYDIRAIASRNGTNAQETAKKFGAQYAATDYQQVLQDPEIDMVLISTRHNLHARMAIEAARAGKAILLEKPMALNEEELSELEQVLRETKAPFLVGFNRRFSPFALRAKELIGQPLSPIIVLYRVNAGHMPLDHWVHGPEGGGRIIGEACHMIDFFSFLTDSTIESIDVSSIDPKSGSVIHGDNVLAALKYANGAVCSLIYTSQGAKEYGKEYIEVHVDQKTIVIDNFKSLAAYGTKFKQETSSKTQKGHLEELKQFAGFLIGHQDWSPISLESMVETTKATFEIEKALWLPVSEF